LTPSTTPPSCDDYDDDVVDVDAPQRPRHGTSLP